jgi:hypothetical protein
MARKTRPDNDKIITLHEAARFLVYEQTIIRSLARKQRCSSSHQGWVSIPFDRRDSRGLGVPTRFCDWCGKTLTDRSAVLRNLRRTQKLYEGDKEVLDVYRGWAHSSVFGDLFNWGPENEELEEEKKQDIKLLIAILIYLSRRLKSSKRRSSGSVRRRPPPHCRRRSCASANNPRPQPSLVSEYLSRFALSVCQSTRTLASYSS